MTHRDGLPRFSARSVRRGDAGHRKACATPSKSLGKPSLWVMINAPWYKPFEYDAAPCGAPEDTR